MPGHSVVRMPSATEQGRPTLGPPLQMPEPPVHRVGSATPPLLQLAPSLPELAQTKPPAPSLTHEGAGLLQVTGNVAHSAGGLKHVGATGPGADWSSSVMRYGIRPPAGTGSARSRSRGST